MPTADTSGSFFSAANSSSRNPPELRLLLLSCRLITRYWVLVSLFCFPSSSSLKSACICTATSNKRAAIPNPRVPIQARNRPFRLCKIFPINRCSACIKSIIVENFGDKKNGCQIRGLTKLVQLLFG